MKTRIQHLALILLALALIGSTGGCVSLAGGPLTLKQTRDDADWAMLRFHNRQTYGFLTPEEVQRVTAAYKAYQPAFNAAVKQANGNYNAPTPPNVAGLANELAMALASIP